MQTTVKDLELNLEITTYYRRIFDDGKGWGYSFECDENGVVDETTLNEISRENYQKCAGGEAGLFDKGVHKYENTVRLCSCGSGEYPEEVYDARGIFVANVCDKCRKERLWGYRPEIFTDSDYWCDEPIDEDY